MPQIGDHYENVRDYTVSSYRSMNVVPCPWTYPARTVFEVADYDNLRNRVTLIDYNCNEFDVDMVVFAAHFAATPKTMNNILRSLRLLLLPPGTDFDSDENEPEFTPDNSKTANDCNGICYFCGNATEPLFGNQRICRRCNK